MQIDANVAEADVGGVVEAQNVDFTVDAYPTRTFHGMVVQVRNSPTTVNNVVTYDCVIGVTNADYKLKPGMTANVSIVVAHREDALTIPNSALRFHPPNAGMVTTNAAASQVAPASTNGNPAGAGGGQGHRGGGHPRGERPVIHTVYLFSGEGKDAALQSVQIKTGISDGIATEVLSGLNEGDKVVTGVALLNGSTAAPSNPFPRR